MRPTVFHRRGDRNRKGVIAVALFRGFEVWPEGIRLDRRNNRVAVEDFDRNLLVGVVSVPSPTRDDVAVHGIKLAVVIRRTRLTAG